MNRENLKIALMLVALFAAVAIPVTIAILATYHMTATITKVAATTYLDSACTTELPTPYDWGTVEHGSTLSVWVKNTGNVAIDITVTIDNAVDCTVAPSLSTISSLAVGNSQKLDLTISTTATGGTAISWDLNLDATQA